MIKKTLFIICILFLLNNIAFCAWTDISLALDKKSNIYFLSQKAGILYKLDSNGKILLSTEIIKNKDKHIFVKDIYFFSSDNFGNIYALNWEANEIVKLGENFNVENGWNIDISSKSLPVVTIGANDKFFISISNSGFFEYSPAGQLITQLLEEPKCVSKNKIAPIGAKRKIAAYDRQKVLVWNTNNDITKVYNLNMESGICNEEPLSGYINNITYDKKGRVIVLAPSWLQVVGFFYVKSNSDIYPKSFSPVSIAIDNLNNYYVYNLDAHEILVIKDTGKINKIIKLEESIKVN